MLSEGAHVILAKVPKEQTGSCRRTYGVVNALLGLLEDVRVRGPPPYREVEGVDGDLNRIRGRGSYLPADEAVCDYVPEPTP